MSDHIPDATKMISDSPRMQSALLDHPDAGFAKIWQVGCDIELELNAANERIKRLEESENRMLNWLTEDCPESVKKQLSNAWMKSKEAKP
jgi:hypothetical protein